MKILTPNADDDLLAKQFEIGKTLGATHLTAELPAHSDTSTATLKRVGDMALKHGMFAAYHSHLQGSITAFDEAFAASKATRPMWTSATTSQRVKWAAHRWTS